MATSRGRWAAMAVAETLKAENPKTRAKVVGARLVDRHLRQVVALARLQRERGRERLGRAVVAVRAVLDGHLGRVDRLRP